jgi:cytochrome oxidase Cu insertion factor (SCO1/SenC/PrrC family)
MIRNRFPLILLALLTFILAACASQPAVDNPMVGTKAPDFTLENTLGGQVSLSDYQGTPVLLFFHMAVG